MKKTPANPKGRRTDGPGARTAFIKAKQRHWAAIIQEVKKHWSEDNVQEQARLLAPYHNVGSMRVPQWVKRIYVYMEWYVFTGEHANIILIKLLNSMHGESGLWVPEQGIFWECNSSTGESDEESTNEGSSDGSGSDNS